MCYRSTRLTVRDVTLSPLRNHPIGSFFLLGVTTPIVSADEGTSRVNECNILCRNASHVHNVDRIVSEKRRLQKILQRYHRISTLPIVNILLCLVSVGGKPYGLAMSLAHI